MDPIFAGKLNGGRIFLDLIPVSLVPHVACSFSSLLDGLDTIISAESVSEEPRRASQVIDLPYALVRPDCISNVLLSGTFQANCNRHAIFHGLSSTLC